MCHKMYCITFYMFSCSRGPKSFDESGWPDEGGGWSEGGPPDGGGRSIRWFVLHRFTFHILVSPHMLATTGGLASLKPKVSTSSMPASATGCSPEIHLKYKPVITFLIADVFRAKCVSHTENVVTCLKGNSRGGGGLH